MGRVLETFHLVRERLPKSLNAQALLRAELIAAHIPDSANSHNLEFRLNSGPQIDFLTFCGSKRVVGQFEQALGQTQSPVWRHNLRALKAWELDDGPLSDVPFFSLEYDGGERFVESEPEANISAATDERHLARHWEPLRGETDASRARGKRAYRFMLPQAGQDACMSIIERIYAALPASGAVLHAPVLSARSPVVAKPYVVLPRGGVFEFLEKIGWPGSMAALQRLLDTFYVAFPKSVYLDLTVTDRVHSRLGVVTSQFQRQETDFSTLDWWGLPASLAHFKDELRAWPGFSEERLGNQRIWLQRWLDTKAVLHDKEIEYKAYLGFNPKIPPLFS